MRTYELVFIADPRLGEEEVVALSDGFKQLVEQGGASVTKEQSWGKRRLAYPIKNLTEGSYVLFEVKVDEANPLAEVEQRMRQHDDVLRYLTVRVDKGRLRRRGDAALQQGDGHVDQEGTEAEEGGE